MMETASGTSCGGPRVAEDICRMMNQQFKASVEMLNDLLERELDGLGEFRSRLLQNLAFKKDAEKRKLDVNGRAEGSEQVSKKKRPSEETTQMSLLDVENQPSTSTPNEKQPAATITDVRFSTRLTKIYPTKALRPSKKKASIKPNATKMNLEDILSLPNSPIVSEDATEKTIVPTEVSTALESAKVEKKPDEFMPPPKEPIKRKRQRKANPVAEETVGEMESESETTINSTTRKLRRKESKVLSETSTRSTRGTSRLASMSVEGSMRVTRMTRAQSKLVSISQDITEEPEQSVQENTLVATVTEEQPTVSKTYIEPNSDSSFEGKKRDKKRRGKNGKLTKTKTKSTEDDSDVTELKSDSSFEDKKDGRKRATKKRQLKKGKSKDEDLEKAKDVVPSTSTEVSESNNAIEATEQQPEKKQRGRKPKLASTKTLSNEERTGSIDKVNESTTPSVEAPPDVPIEEPSSSKTKTKGRAKATKAQSIEKDPIADSLGGKQEIAAKISDEDRTLTKEDTPKSQNRSILVEEQKMDDAVVASMTVVDQISPKKISNEHQTCASDPNATMVISKNNKNLNVTEVMDVTDAKEAKMAKKPALDETVVISVKSTDNTKQSSKQPVGNETIVITNKPDDNQYKAQNSIDVSLLPNDVSEIAETPPKKVNEVPKSAPANAKNQFFESPVKMKVRHFEKLAESAVVAAPANKIANDVPKATRNRLNSQTKLRQIGANGPSADEDTLDFVKSSKANTTRTTPLNPKKIVKVSALTGSVTKKPTPGAELFSPKTGTQLNHTGGNYPQESAAAKRDLLYQKKIEEQKRKREEKFRAAALAREAQEKLKAATLERIEREKQEKIKQLQQERREEYEKKRLAQEARAAEKLRIAAQREAAEQAKKTYDKENVQRIMDSAGRLKSNGRVSNFVADSDKLFDDIMELDEQLEEKNASSSERAKAWERLKPAWAKRINLDAENKYQRYLATQVIDKLYSVRVFSPDLTEIFPNIDRTKLKRTSSAVWKTPPRCSMMPKLN